MIEYVSVYLGIGIAYAIVDFIYEWYFGDLDNSGFEERFADIVAVIMLVVILTWPFWLAVNLISLLVKVIAR